MKNLSALTNNELINHFRSSTDPNIQLLIRRIEMFQSYVDGKVKEPVPQSGLECDHHP